MSGGHGTIATGESASFFHRLYEKEAIMDTYRYSGLQIAKQLDSREDIVDVIVM